MALFHFHVDQIGRSAGRSAVACAAYRSGEKLYSEYYGETSDYTRKGGVMYSEIMLPPMLRWLMQTGRRSGMQWKKQSAVTMHSWLIPSILPCKMN